MQVDPKKSREAHSQTGHLTEAAASSLSQHLDSPASAICAVPQPVPCRGDGAGQRASRPFREHRLGMDDQPLDYPIGVRFIHPDQLERIAARPARHITIDPLPTWREGAWPLGLGTGAAIIAGLAIAYAQSRGWL